MTRRQKAGVLATCLVAAMSYAGAVTVAGLVLFVLPGVVLAAVGGLCVAPRRMASGSIVIGGLLALGWAELVNLWSGTAYGAAARATFFAAFCSVCAVVLAPSSWPALFAVAIVGLVGGAVMLGAGGEVRLVAVAVVVAVALVLASIEASRRRWMGAPPARASVIGLSLCVGAVAAATAVAQANFDENPPELMAAGQGYPRIKPPWPDPFGSANKAHSRTWPARQRPTSVSPPAGRSRREDDRVQPQRPPGAREHWPSVWLYVVIGLLVLPLTARLLVTRLAWRRLRRRLARGTPAQQVAGAWTWALMRLDTYRQPLPAAISPDMVAVGRGSEQLSPGVADPLQSLGSRAASAAFAREPMILRADARAAWKAATEVDAAARRRLKRRARVGVAFRSPRSDETV